jgi:DNA-directed RNA polymerase subunit RPC12/RpoP
MFEINCEKCGSELIIDMIATRDEYNKDMNYLLDDKSEVIESTIQQYLIYKCLDCGEIYKYI